MRGMIVVIAACALLSAACGGSSGSDDRADDATTDDAGVDDGSLIDGPGPSCLPDGGSPSAACEEWGRTPLEIFATLCACGAGSRCQSGPERCLCSSAWGSVCTTCPIEDADIDPTPPVGTTCSRSDWEHDYTCTFDARWNAYACCGQVGGTTVCSGGACGEQTGAACCAGQVDPGGTLTCVDGAWQ